MKVKLTFVLAEARRVADRRVAARAVDFVSLSLAGSISAASTFSSSSSSTSSFVRILRGSSVVGDTITDAPRRAPVTVAPRRGRGSMKLRERGVLRRELARPRVEVALHRVDLALDLGDARLRGALDPSE
ncbi:hypothetical protein GSI_13290 [Ganoderma sinense ZZ0214-1]|uniref:Uncharacterized protein n=1 Tax=Ganoderma sinense ZZ0214-1 TaxID=1077348 RepID=A0A2G8RV58_9APHY|nr:hypothetical protein GSI_13290 [Ganoderma sinense ZZ0214-1]